MPPIPIERVSCRPDFLILCYAVIAFGEPFTPRIAQTNLLGAECRPHAGAEPLQRETSNVPNPADVPFPH